MLYLTKKSNKLCSMNKISIQELFKDYNIDTNVVYAPKYPYASRG
jgi:hypothetical protein